MQEIEQAINLIRCSKRVVALSGAGISTEAGIPDFRGPEGMWQDESLLNLLSASGFQRDPEAFYRASMRLFITISRSQPTLGHRLLAEMEKMGKVQAVITQNIDGLHQAAGSRQVYEIHGTYRTGRCVKCNIGFDMMPFYAEMEHGRLKVPMCPKCLVPIKPDIVLFEDLLPWTVWKGSLQAAEQCELMLIFGSSLLVYPAAELPMIALESGARLVIVNLERTPYDGSALTIQAKIGDFAQAIFSVL
jgi:NAD-dependent deacetylase